MKTLQECKDEVSFEMFSVPYDKLLVLGSQLNILEQAAKRFAKEMCKEQREICAAAIWPETLNDHMEAATLNDAQDKIKNNPEPTMI